MLKLLYDFFYVCFFFHSTCKCLLLFAIYVLYFKQMCLWKKKSFTLYNFYFEKKVCISLAYLDVYLKYFVNKGVFFTVERFLSQCLNLRVVFWDTIC